VGAELRQSNGQTDQVHLLVHYPPGIALSVLVNSLKRRVVSQAAPAVSRPCAQILVGQALPVISLLRHASSGGAPLPVIKQYIDRQNRPTKRDPLRGPYRRGSASSRKQPGFRRKMVT
jgi:REP-associated tyrosine transposase